MSTFRIDPGADAREKRELEKRVERLVHKCGYGLRRAKEEVYGPIRKELKKTQDELWRDGA